MTLQELFDLTWTHFVVNKAPPSFDAEDKVCRYRGPNGTKCAIGLAIPDEMYSTGMDRAGGIWSLDCLFPDLLPKLFPGVPTGHLGTIQRCHDRACMKEGGHCTGEEFTRRIEERLRLAAEELKLAIPVTA